MVRKPVKKQMENQAGCAGDGKQIKGNIGEGKRTVNPTKFELCDEITRRMCDGELGLVGRGGREGRGGVGKRSGTWTNSEKKNYIRVIRYHRR